jgi:hypothetical protein
MFRGTTVVSRVPKYQRKVRVERVLMINAVGHAIPPLPLKWRGFLARIR